MAKAKQKKDEPKLKYLVHTLVVSYVQEATEGGADLEAFKDTCRENGHINSHDVELIEAESFGEALNLVYPPVASG